MKQRLVVMNGQRLLQSAHGDEWRVDKVDKAGLLRPGIYNLYLSSPADRSQAYEGVIVHTDSEHVFQQVGKAYVRHDRSAFETVPEIGSTQSVQYIQARAIAAPISARQSRGIAR